MIQKVVPSERAARTLMCLVLLLAHGALAQEHSPAGTPASASPLRVTHILGFEGISNNASGDLSIQGGVLQFRKSGGSEAHINISSIQDVSLGMQDKQVGGTAMAVGKAAAPFGGGRVVGLFAHKKYDTLTLQYLDPDGGLHGAIFQLNKGQAQTLKDELEAGGARVSRLEDKTTEDATEETKNEIE